jgi:hypothetical protein
MSSGTLVWGLCNSVFREDPAAGAAWVGQYGALVDTFQVYYVVDSFNWDNSWNVAYLNAHFAMGDLSGDPVFEGYGEKLTNLLLSYDTDDDGGIPSTTADPESEDMSWVTSYLAKFGVARLLGTPLPEDAGVLSFLSPQDGQTIILGADDPIPVRVVATNFGLQPLTDVAVRVEGAATGEVEIDLDYVEREEVELHPGWLPSAPGVHELVALTEIAGDGGPANDTLRIRVHAIDVASAPGSPFRPPAVAVRPNPSAGPVTIGLHRPSGQGARLEIVRVDGRRVREWSWSAGTADRVGLEWDGADASGRPAPPGVYLLRALVGGRSETVRIVRLDD